MPDTLKVLILPSIRAIFEGAVEPLFEDDRPPLRLVVYSGRTQSESREEETTLGVLDRERDLYFEVSFRGDTVVNCRKYTPDNFSHGTPLGRFREDYLDALSERLPPEIKRRLWGLFRSGEDGLDRHVGGFVITYVDKDGHWREKCCNVENAYL